MDFRNLVKGDYAGRPWIVCAEVSAGATGLVKGLHHYGVSKVMLLTGTRGIGEVPDVPTVELGTTGRSIMGGIRAYERAVLDLPDHAIDAIEDFDPDHQAQVLFAGFGTPTQLAGRTVFAPRRPEWLELENKITAVDLWARAGIASAPYLIVSATISDLRDAHATLDSGLGTVWVADNRTGWHGGGEYLRRVRSAADVGPAAEFMAPNANRVRVMPFLDGIPCSIHGFVTADDIAVFRPVEMLILWRGNDLVYSGLATTWDPSPEDREDMRSAARALAVVMRDHVEYRGAFSLDGIMTADGFRPTEINPRLSTGLAIQLGAIDDIPLGSLTRHLIANPDAAVDVREIEARVVGTADHNRAARAMFSTDVVLDSDERVVRLSDTGVEEDPGGPIRLSAGPALHGGLVFGRCEPGALPAGGSFAPIVARLAPYVEQWLDVDIGELEFAQDVRAR